MVVQLADKLAALGVKLRLRDGKLKFVLPWPVDRIPEEARPVLREACARAQELENYLRAKMLFPYPLPETLGLGAVDPMDIRYENGQPVFDPGWWRDIRDRRVLH